MHKKLWLSIAVAIVGAGLLVAASAAGTATKTVPVKAGHAVAGGTFNVELSTDVDYTDPALDYLSTGWEIAVRDDVQAAQLPGQAGAGGLAAHPRGCGRLPHDHEQREALHLHDSPGFKFNTGQAVTAKSFADTINRHANPKLQSPAQPFLDVIAGASCRDRRQGEHDLGREGQPATS